MMADLLRRFLDFAHSRNLFTTGDRILAAVSGGPDSTAMLDLFRRAGFDVVTAHCNFRLRGPESDEDEVFVRGLAQSHESDFVSVHFNTAEHASQTGISIQMAARELRYSWFEKARKEKNCDWIAVAHQADDSVETVVTNLIRGTGLRGMAGIREKQGFIIRPLLFATRLEILDYLDFRNLAFREDSSNKDIHYLRNRIRHQLLPEIEKINPGFKKITLNNQAYFRDAQELAEKKVLQLKPALLSTTSGDIRIRIDQLKEQEFKEILLFELLRPYGFHGRQIPGILASLDGPSGKVFESESFSLLRDRDYLIIVPRSEQDIYKYYIDPDIPEPDLPLNLTFQVMTGSMVKPPPDPNQAWLDIQRLDYPLIIRKWEKGDFFYPLGMNNPKKLSDFFIDNKISLFEKARTWLLTSGEKIVWVIGHRIDQRFRITPHTRKILTVTYIPEIPADPFD